MRRVAPDIVTVAVCAGPPKFFERRRIESQERVRAGISKDEIDQLLTHLYEVDLDKKWGVWECFYNLRLPAEHTAIERHTKRSRRSDSTE
jgi:hypothetical protein